MRHLHLTHPRLDFWVTVEIHERGGRYMVTADLGEDSRASAPVTPQQAVMAALMAPGRAVRGRDGAGRNRRASGVRPLR